MPATQRIIEPSPLALAVLAVLFEHPSHPYDIQRTLRERGKDQVIRFKPAAVYRMVERLVEAGLVEEVGTDREGKRPERTVYRLTEESPAVVMQWLREMLTKPAEEYPLFRAAISFLPLLLPDDARVVLEMRVALLDGEIARLRAFMETASRTGFPRLFMLEDEQRRAAFEAERAWTQGVVDDLASGRLQWDHESLRQLAAVGAHPFSPLGDEWRGAQMA